MRTGLCVPGGRHRLALRSRKYEPREKCKPCSAELDAAGIPMDDASAERAFFNQTRREGTHDWAEVLSMLGNSWVTSLGAELPYVGTGKIPVRLDPDSAWPQLDAAGKYLQIVAPVLQRVRVAAKHPAPVWQPIHFHGLGTLLGPIQDARHVANNLQLSRRVWASTARRGSRPARHSADASYCRRI